MAGIYIHIPFCGSKCAYCDFYSRPPGDEALIDAYVDAVIGEWNIRRAELQAPVETIYIGGGTPSLLGTGRLAHLFDNLPWSDCREITIEANPEQIDRDFIARLLDTTPTNRVSIGVQSFNDDELRLVGRRHDSHRAILAMEALAAAPLLSYSIDLIYGLPLQDESDWERNLTTALQFAPPHISAYMLSYEPRTRLDAMRLAGKVTPADDETLCRMYGALCDRLSHNGYRHYEISNFALEGHRALHNSNYWRGLPYIGLGAGAHSCTSPGVRRENLPDLRGYIATGGLDAPHSIEHESTADRINDYIMVALRTSRGINAEEFKSRFGAAEYKALLRRAALEAASGAGLIMESDGSIAFTEEGWLTSDAVIAELFTES